MIKKCRKIIYVGPCLFLFLFIIFLCLYIDKVSAVGLEVQYPVISGQSLGANALLPDYIKYLFNAGMFLGFFAVFISLIIAGIMYLLSPAKPNLLADAKDRISGAISGLLILVLTYLIITTINPQLNVFTFNKLPPAPPPPAEKKAPGVYFYKDSADCPDNDAQLVATYSVSDLDVLKNQVTSLGIVQDAITRTSYISILYDEINFWGKCQYITTNDSVCKPIDNFAASASIHAYDFNPGGGGVYFYRRSSFVDSGGSFWVDKSKIKGIYIERLENLKFENVPLEEQDCVKYDADGSCVERTPPSLAGENISSVRIKGKYILLFTYAPPGQNCKITPWSFCQEFPTVDDANALGPRQIKWQNIRNIGGAGGGVVPNCVIIIPVKN